MASLTKIWWFLLNIFNLVPFFIGCVWVLRNILCIFEIKFILKNSNFCFRLFFKITSIALFRSSRDLISFIIFVRNISKWWALKDLSNDILYWWDVETKIRLFNGICVWKTNSRYSGQILNTKGLNPYIFL